MVPANTRITMYTDGVTGSLYEVKTLVTLGAPVTESFPGGSVTFTTIASYDTPEADITSHDSNEVGFYVERSTDGKTWARVAALGANATSYTDGNLMRRRTYWYRVQAYSSAGASAYSNVVSASPACGCK